MNACSCFFLHCTWDQWSISNKCIKIQIMPFVPLSCAQPIMYLLSGIIVFSPTSIFACNNLVNKQAIAMYLPKQLAVHAILIYGVLHSSIHNFIFSRIQKGLGLFNPVFLPPRYDNIYYIKMIPPSFPFPLSILIIQRIFK